MTSPCMPHQAVRPLIHNSHKSDVLPSANDAEARRPAETKFNASHDD